MSPSEEKREASDREEQPLERIDTGWWGVVVAIILVGAGIAAGSPLLVAASTIPLWFVAATTIAMTPAGSVQVGRELGYEASEGDHPDVGAGTLSGDPGRIVTVRVHVENTGVEPIPDLRIIDGVPPELPVVSGTPRACVTLEAGEKTTLEYDVELRRGEHTFGDATVRLRGINPTLAETWTADVFGDDAVQCLPAVHSVPVHGGTNDYAGEVPTDEGGSGVEFYSVREYEPGDPVRSIDWRRYARSRDLATVEYRAERATRVVCVVDARRSQRRAQSERHLPALERSIGAAQRTFETIHDAGHPTGVVGLDRRLLTAVSPGTDAETLQLGRSLLADLWEPDLERARQEPSNPVSDSILNPPIVEQEQGQHVRRRWGSPVNELPGVLPGEAQVFLFSSFADDAPVDVVERLRVHGYQVCVISPDVTSEREDLAGRLKAAERRTRLAEIREMGVRVIDWEAEQPVGVLLSEAIPEVSSR